MSVREWSEHGPHRSAPKEDSERTWTLRRVWSDGRVWDDLTVTDRDGVVGEARYAAQGPKAKALVCVQVLADGVVVYGVTPEGAKYGPGREREG